MKKRVLAALLCAAMMLSACGLQAPADSTNKTDVSSTESNVEATADAITLVYAEVNPLDTIVGMTDQKFKEAVEELSGGSIIIDLQASGVLGSENDVLDTMLGGGGTIDMSRISAFALTGYGPERGSDPGIRHRAPAFPGN